MIKFESVTKAYDPINPALRDIDLMIETCCSKCWLCS